MTDDTGANGNPDPDPWRVHESFGNVATKWWGAGWQVWKGVGMTGRWYARKPLTSPPAVVSDTTPAGLDAKITAWMADHAAWRAQ